MKPQLSRPPVLRMLKIHEAFQRERFPNCSGLAGELEVSVKTIQRDIDYMRDQLRLPIEYKASRRGYGYTEKVDAFPTIQITEGEVMALLVAGKALEQYRGTPYEAQLRTTFEKLAASLDNIISFTPGSGLAAVSFGSLGQTTNDIAVFELLSRAVVKHQEIGFEYRKPGSRHADRRSVQPYHLAYRDNLCYLIGRDLTRRALRQFALTRIGKVTVLERTFAVPDNFSVNDFFKGALGAVGGQGDYTVQIRFDSTAAFYVRERQWHPTQVLRDLPEGALEMKMKLSALEEAERWVLSWGAHAEVVGPRELLDLVKGTIARLAGKYDQTGSPP